MLLEGRGDETFRLEAAARIQEAAEVLETAVGRLFDELEERRAERSSNGERVRVLVVDDDEVVRELLTATLDETTYGVTVAADGDEALELLANRPALLILDWFVPGGGGERVLAAAKAELPSMPVIVLTGDKASSTRERAAGADVFMTKPFSPLELLENVERLTQVSER
jgi:CheY-like chemotaxis protein